MKEGAAIREPNQDTLVIGKEMYIKMSLEVVSLNLLLLKKPKYYESYP